MSYAAPMTTEPVLTRRPVLRTLAVIGLVWCVGAAIVVGSMPRADSAPTAGAVQGPALDTSPSGPVSAWSTTTGTDGRVYLADAKGRALQLHGFNVKTPDPDTVTDDLLAKAAERGMDHLRLSIFWQDLEPTQGNYDEAYLDKVVAAVDRAAAHGIRVILDMHQDVYGEAFSSRGAPTWATRTEPTDPPFEAQPSWLLDYLQPAVQSAFDHLYNDADLRQAQIDVWLHVVERVKGNPGILGFDLMNEPFGKIYPGETLISAAERVERDQLTPMYQRLTDAISAVDPAHWVFIEPPNLASLGIATSLGRVTGPKVALYPHMYDTDLESSTYDPNSDQYTYDPAFFKQWSDAITTYTAKYPMPMLIGEWGIAKPEAHSMDAFVRDSLATFDRVSSGWSMFNFCEGSGYCPLDAAGNDRPNISQIFEPYARAIAGAPTASTYDFSTRELRVRFRDNGATGPTEIFLPASRAYPDGWVVKTSDATGTWSHTYDPATGVEAVTVSDTGDDHVICVAPVGSTAACTLEDPPPAAAPAPAPAATPVATTPTYTG